MTVIAQSHNLKAVARCPNRSRQCVVTFTSYTDDRTLDRPGFGEDFLRDAGLDAIHVISRDNDWYLYPELDEVAAAVREQVGAYEEVFSYGSSMGGYAAIRHGRRFGASTGIAISPQYSLDRRIVPFESRWVEGTRLDFGLEEEGGDGFVETAFILYDPFDDDRKHVDLFRRRSSVIDVKVPFAGHPVSGVLVEVGVLKRVVLDVIHSRFDDGVIREAMRAKRKTSLEYLFSLSKRTRSRGRKLRLRRQIVEQVPGHAYLRAQYASALEECALFAEAERQFGIVRFELPFSIPSVLLAAEFYERMGNVPAAIASFEDVVRHEPHVARFTEKLAALKALPKQEVRHHQRTIVLQPGQRLPREFHCRRSEHWLVTSGEAEFEIGGEVVHARPGQSAYVPRLARHGAVGLGAEPTVIVELQVGEEVGAADIQPETEALRSLSALAAGQPSPA